MNILDNNNNPITIHRCSELPNGAKYTRNGKFILKVACTKATGNSAIFKEYKPSFHESNYFDNMNESGKRKFLEAI